MATGYSRQRKISERVKEVDLVSWSGCNKILRSREQSNENAKSSLFVVKEMGRYARVDETIAFDDNNIHVLSYINFSMIETLQENDWHR